MPKMPKILRFLPTATRYLLECKYLYDKEMNGFIKQFPGTRWDNNEKCFMVPKELESLIAARGTEKGYKVIEHEPIEHNLFGKKINTKLYPYQQKDVAIALKNRRHIPSYEMGCGKTPVAIEALRLDDPNKILIVCPAMVRSHWISEIAVWWSSDIEICQYIRSGQDCGTARVVVTSYELARNFVGEKFDAIILDELHYIKEARSSRSKVINKLCRDNNSALILGLTATPITNEPKDIWHQVDCLWPGRLGNFWCFTKRYCLLAESEYSRYGKIYGVASDYANELHTRLSTLSTRVSKVDAAEYLPPLNIIVERLPNRGHGDLTLYDDRFENFQKHKELIGQHLERAGDAKVDAVLEKAKLGKEGTSHICILTHRKDSARDIANEFADAVLITGDVTPEKRHEAIERAKNQETATVVATMHSVGIGIDLTFCPIAIFAELYWQPAIVIQTMGRFHRLTSKVPVSIYILVLEGTLDERVGASLKRKMDDVNEVLKLTESEEKTQEALSPKELTEDEFLLELNKAARSGL